MLFLSLRSVISLVTQWQQVARNFRVITRTDQFLNLSPDCIQRLLHRDDLSIDSEMEVAKAAVRWLNFDREKRKKFTRSVMSCIRFKDLWPEELVRLTSNHLSLLADDSIKEAIFEANWYVLHDVHRHITVAEDHVGASLKLLFSTGPPGLGAPPSSYLEVALYKFNR